MRITLAKSLEIFSAQTYQLQESFGHTNLIMNSGFVRGIEVLIKSFTTKLILLSDGHKQKANTLQKLGTLDGGQD